MSDVRINRRLNLVIPVTSDDGEIIAHVHSVPISRETFETYDWVLAPAFAFLSDGGMSESVAPNMAASVLKRVSQRMDQWESVQKGLFPEIFRLTSVIAPAQGAWEPLPWDVAVQRGILNDDEVREVTGAIIFFTLVSLLSRRIKVAEKLKSAGLAWGFATTSLTSTEYGASLPTLMKDEPSGEKKAAVFSVPS